MLTINILISETSFMNFPVFEAEANVNSFYTTWVMSKSAEFKRVLQSFSNSTFHKLFSHFHINTLRSISLVVLEQQMNYIKFISISFPFIFLTTFSFLFSCYFFMFLNLTSQDVLNVRPSSCIVQIFLFLVHENFEDKSREKKLKI